MIYCAVYGQSKCYVVVLVIKEDATRRDVTRTRPKWLQPTAFQFLPLSTTSHNLYLHSLPWRTHLEDLEERFWRP